MAITQEFNGDILVAGEVLAQELNSTGSLSARMGNIIEALVVNGSITAKAGAFGNLTASFLNSTGTSTNQTMSQLAITNAINSAASSNIHPVGEIYTSTASTSPASIFGGTWEQLTADAYFKIVTSNAGNLGGTSSHKMPAAALPNHVHPIYCVTSVNTSVLGNHALGTLYSGARNHDQYTLPNSDRAQEPYYPYYYGIYAWHRIA